MRKEKRENLQLICRTLIYELHTTPCRATQFHKKTILSQIMCYKTLSRTLNFLDNSGAIKIKTHNFGSKGGRALMIISIDASSLDYYART